MSYERELSIAGIFIYIYVCVRVRARAYVCVCQDETYWYSAGVERFNGPISLAIQGLQEGGLTQGCGGSDRVTFII